MELIFVIGRVLFAAVFLASGLGHFQQRDSMVGYARAKGAPNPELWVPLTGAAIIVAAVMVALGLWADVGALILAVFVITTAFVMHAFWKESDAGSASSEQVQFMKNLSLGGAALVLFYFYNQLQDVDASLTDALLGRI